MKLSKKLLLLNGSVFCYLGLMVIFFFTLGVKTDETTTALTPFYQSLALIPFSLSIVALIFSSLTNVFYFRKTNSFSYSLFYTLTLLCLFGGVSTLAYYFYLV